MQQNLCLWNSSVCTLIWLFYTHVFYCLSQLFFNLTYTLLSFALCGLPHFYFSVPFFLFILLIELSHFSCVAVTQGSCNVSSTFWIEHSTLFLFSHYQSILVITLWGTHFLIFFRTFSLWNFPTHKVPVTFFHYLQKDAPL